MHIPGGSFIFNISFMGQPSFFLTLINSLATLSGLRAEHTIPPGFSSLAQSPARMSSPFFATFLPVGKNRTGR